MSLNNNEVQDQIWAHLLGHRVIHVKYVHPVKEPPPFATRLSHHNPPKPGLYHETCIGRSKSDNIHQRQPMTWFHGVKPGVRAMLPAVCHQECLASARDFDQEKSYRPYLPLMLTCQAMHTAAMRVLYTTNTFCFIPRGNNDAGGFSLTRFCASLSQTHGAWLRILYIRTWTRCLKDRQVLEAHFLPGAWADIVQNDKEGLKKLTGLTRLTIEFIRVLTWHMPRPWVSAVDTFDSLKDLNLKELNVLIWDMGTTTSTTNMIGHDTGEHQPAFAAHQGVHWWDTAEYQSLGRRFRQRFLGLTVEAPLSDE